MKKICIIVVILAFFLCGFQSPAAKPARELEIVSDYSDTIPDIASYTGEEESLNHLMDQAVSYAEYTEDGVKMVRFPSARTAGNLIYTIKNPRIVDQVGSGGMTISGLSADTRMVFSEADGWQELESPNWIKEDGSFETGYSVLLVDINVYNNQAVQDEQYGKNGEFLGENAFSAAGLIYLSNMEPTRTGRSYLYTDITYYDAIKSDTDYPWLFNVLPGEEVEFTVGFVLGPQFPFGNDEKLFLTNTCGNTKGVYVQVK